MYPGAGFYGIKEIMLSYAKLPNYFPFPVAVQHGWQCIATSFESSAKPPEIWVWSERIAKDYERFYPKAKIRVVGSFFSYYMKLTVKNNCEDCCQGSICITPHSSHFARTEYSIDKYINGLSALGSEYMPITVMLYYLDMKPEIIDAYNKAGFNVVANGSLFSSDFIPNFIENVSGKRYCIYSDIGSAVFFCSDMGLDLVRLDVPSTFLNMGNIHLSEHKSADSVDQMEALLRSFGKEDYVMELGKENLLSSSEMRNMILRNYLSREFIGKIPKRMAYKALQFCGLKSTVKLE